MRSQLRTILLLGALSALLIGVGSALAPGYLYLFAVLALAMNLGAYFFSDRIVLAMQRARQVSEEEEPVLHGVVAELAAQARLPQPRVFLIAEEQPNAFATGRNPAHGVVAVTEGLLRLLDRRELRGVLAHELSHIKNRDILVSSIAAAGASLITYLAQVLSFGTLFGGSHGDSDDSEGSAAGGLLLALVAPLAATLIQLGISRSREYLADDSGAHLADDPEALASALAKLERGAELVPGDTSPATASLFIVNPLHGGGGLQRLFSTHPPIAERIERLLRLAGHERRRRRRDGLHHDEERL